MLPLSSAPPSGDQAPARQAATKSRLVPPDDSTHATVGLPVASIRRRVCAQQVVPVLRRPPSSDHWPGTSAAGELHGATHAATSNAANTSHARTPRPLFNTRMPFAPDRPAKPCQANVPSRPQRSPGVTLDTLPGLLRAGFRDPGNPSVG